MQFESARAPTSLRDDPDLRLFGGVTVLVFVALFLQIHVEAAYGSVVGWAMERLGARRVQAILTGGLLLGVLGLWYWTRGTRGQDAPALEGHEFLTLAGSLCFLVVVGTFWIQGRVGVASVPETVFGAVLRPALAFGLPALAFARLSGRRLRIALPDRETTNLVAWAVVLATVVALLHVGVLGLIREPVVTGPFLGSLSLRSVLLTAMLPALVVGLGFGLVFNGAVQEALRTRLGLAGAITAVTTLVGATAVAIPVLLRQLGIVWQAGVVAGVALLGVLFGRLAALAARHLSRRAAVTFTPTVAAASGVAAVGLLSGGTVVYDLDYGGVVLSATALALVAGIACVTYERSRSVWAPGAAFGTYLILLSWPISRWLLSIVP